MPVYNTERFLPEAIQSVLDQSFKNFELLIVNDGSPGPVESIVSHFDDPRIILLNQINMGPSASRNHGVKASKGEYIAFLDSDDVWESGKLTRQMELFHSIPHSSIVYSQRSYIDGAGREVDGYKMTLYDGHILNNLWIDNFICLSSAVLKREVFDSAGLFDESLRMSEDWEFWLRVALNHRFVACPDALVRYRLHGSQASNRRMERREVCRRIIRPRFLASHRLHIYPTARLQYISLHQRRLALEAEVNHPLIAAGHHSLAILAWPFSPIVYKAIVKFLLSLLRQVKM